MQFRSIYFNDNGLLKVGDQLNQLTLEEDIKHPLLIPKHSILSKLLIMWCHRKVIHSGRGVTMNQIRSSGFWIVNCNAAVRSFNTICVTYRHLRGSFQLQKMALLSKYTIYEELTFTYCGVGLLVLQFVKKGRKEMKRYETSFICLFSRAVHIEATNSLSTYSFIICLRRFVGRRGNIRVLKSDNGCNFVGASAKLSKLSPSEPNQPSEPSENQSVYERQWW